MAVRKRSRKRKSRVGKGVDIKKNAKDVLVVASEYSNTVKMFKDLGIPFLLYLKAAIIFGFIQIRNALKTIKRKKR